MNILIAIVIFSVIIIIHEFGHFLLAKKNGIGVTEFSVGLGPRIASFKMNETRYSLKASPFGGSCMMLGEDELEDEHAFNRKPVWARISVIAAGPIFNFILAFVLSLIIIGITGYDPATVINVEPGMAAEQAGLKVGDVVTNIDGNNVDIGRELNSYYQFNKITDSPITINYLRDGVKESTQINPILTQTYLMGFSYEPSEMKAEVNIIVEKSPFDVAGIMIGDVITNINGTDITSGIVLNEYFQTNPLGGEAISVTYSREGVLNTVSIIPKLYEEYKLGFGHNLSREKTSALGVIKYSGIEIKYWIVTTIKGLGQMITGNVSKDDIAGPVGIVGLIGNAYEQSKPEGLLTVFLNLAYISILLSANLGVMNLLPIPALDGGRLVFLFLEVLRGKPIAQEKEGMVHAIGLVALMLLMVFIMFNDISRFLNLFNDLSMISD